MELNIKRFASSGEDKLYPNYSYDYTPNGYIRTATVTIVCEYDISSIFLVQGGDEVNDTENWIITEDFRGRPCAKRYFHEPVDVTYNIYCENNETPFSVNVYIANDFQPESEQYPLEINGDIKIAKTTMKLKDVVNSIHNIADIIYPVGSVYISITTTNPKDLFGGTWEQIKDRFLLSAGNMYSAGNTGGSATHSHSLSRNAGANFRKFANKFIQGETTLAGVMQKESESNVYWITEGNSDYSADTPEKPGVSLYGNTDATTNLPPYLAVYMWKRTA